MNTTDGQQDDEHVARDEQVTGVETDYGVRLEMYLSSSAEPPTAWLKIRGGQALDPRDPRRLALLPITNAVQLDVDQLLQLRAACDVWIDELAAVERHG